MSLYFNGTQIGNVGVTFEGTSGTDTSDATLTSGDQMLEGVSAYSKGKKYSGTIPTKEVATPSISVSFTGQITATNTQAAGYTAGATKTATKQLSVQAAKTVTPTTSEQTAVVSGVYTTGAVKVGAISTETKSITSNGTYTPTDGKYFSSVSVNVPSSGIDTSDATATADDIVKGKTAYVNGELITGNVDESTAIVNCLEVPSVTDKYPNSSNTDKIYLFMNGTVRAPDILYRFSNSNKSFYWSTPKTNFGNATAADVAKGKTFTSAAGLKVTGTATTSTSSPTLQTKTVSPSTSQQTITADDGYDGLSSVTINAISTQTKSATPTTSQQTISADSGKYLTSVTVGAIQTETKSITDNGTYTPTSGKYFSSVTVNVPYQTYRTGSGAPSNSLGSDGDLYFDMG